MKDHGCNHWCAAHWWYHRGQYIPYPIVVPGPQMFIDLFVPVPSSVVECRINIVVVHCGPEAVYPLTDEWRFINGEAI